tara:strand:+ start:11878 stop:12132 length:255 start_codon:yes stop_codon:yes gene_type:complete
MALNVAPIYKHLHEILRQSASSRSFRTSKASATTISNKKLTTDEESFTHIKEETLNQKNYNKKKERSQQRDRELKKRLQKLDIV